MAQGHHLLPLGLDDSSEGGENDLPGEIHNAPELGIEDAKGAGVFPEVVDDFCVSHQALEGTLGAGLRVSSRCQGLCKAQKLVRVELAHVAAGGTRGGTSKRGEQWLQRWEEYGEQRIGAFCVKISVQMREGGRIWHGDGHNRQIQCSRLVGGS